jgi:S1-C subfamily serine protease
MSYLEHPLDWTRPEVPELRDLFVLAYEGRAEARSLARAADIVPGTFPDYDNMRTTWTELLIEMARQGKLRRLVEAAAADPAAASYSLRFRDILSGNPSVSTLSPRAGDAWYKGPDRDPLAAKQIHLQRLMRSRSRLLDIRLAEQVAATARSVAYLDLVFQNDERGYGTGFLIGPDLILTNHHNVEHEKFGAVKAITADFDRVEGFAGTALVVKGKTDGIRKDAGHDWAVIQLEQAVDRAPIPLGTPWAVAVDDTVVIIQHPLGAYKKFALDALSVQHVDDEIVQYLADTQDGSSGSPVFNTRMQPIALHHAEASVEIDVAGRKETAWRNEGINIARVMEDLAAAGIAFEKN